VRELNIKYDLNFSLAEQCFLSPERRKDIIFKE